MTLDLFSVKITHLFVWLILIRKLLPPTVAPFVVAFVLQFIKLLCCHPHALWRASCQGLPLYFTDDSCRTIPIHFRRMASIFLSQFAVPNSPVQLSPPRHTSFANIKLVNQDVYKVRVSFSNKIKVNFLFLAFSTFTEFTSSGSGLWSRRPFWNSFFALFLLECLKWLFLI